MPFLIIDMNMNGPIGKDVKLCPAHGEVADFY